ncbi:odorant receptor 67c-like [Battus philenor]|uniref:odorant receptor 67c-like n=1 Tax=Battus philenor TaxID=42288 RepID=UPI0035CF50F9
MAKLSRVMFLLLCHVTSLAKQIVFHTDADRIDALVSGLHGVGEGTRGGRGARLAAGAALHARRLRRGYAGCAALTCALWAVFPVREHARAVPVDFPLWTGLDTTRSHVFAAVLLYTYCVTTLVGIANTTMDAFIAAVLYQCKTELTILRINFEELSEKAVVLSKQSGESRDVVEMKLFVQYWQHYQKICATAWLVQDIFGWAILVQFGIGGWILCMAAYKLVSLTALGVEAASMALFISCILTELFLYCYYGSALTEESARLADAVYAVRWAGAGARTGRLVALLLLRVRRPLRPAAGRVVPLSLDTFVKILRSSYTFYAVLRQTK